MKKDYLLLTGLLFAVFPPTGLFQNLFVFIATTSLSLLKRGWVTAVFGQLVARVLAVHAENVLCRVLARYYLRRYKKRRAML